MAIPKTLSTERDMDITQDVVPAGSVFALEVCEHHEFEEDEFLSEHPVMKTLEERHFNKMERTSDYVFHLPEEDRPDDPYPWRIDGGKESGSGTKEGSDDRVLLLVRRHDPPSASDRYTHEL